VRDMSTGRVPAQHVDPSAAAPSHAWHEKAGKVPVMGSKPRQQEEELVSRLMELFARTLDHQGTCLETLELSYAQAKLIWRLEAGDTPSLKEAARRCGVDPSNLSSVVDQLTERGLTTSRPAAHDKRVRIVRLTGEGVRMRRRLVACMAQNPTVGSLSPAQQKQLLEILRNVA
jgi:MarR family transcriptional regulator, organic hydroperoxide resistance regulator